MVLAPARMLQTRLELDELGWPSKPFHNLERLLDIVTLYFMRIIKI